MAKSGRKYSNQKKGQILAHLEKLLKDNKLYNLTSDPLCIYFELKESRKQPKVQSEKLKNLRKEYSGESKKKRRLAGTRRRTSPKIRSAKKGRTVTLKGVSY